MRSNKALLTGSQDWYKDNWGNSVHPVRYLSGLIFVFLMLLACSENSVQIANPGSGTETIGQLVYPNGSPATGVSVYLRPSDYLPNVNAKIAVRAAFKTLDSTFTDSLGHFSFDSIAPGTYTMECLDGEDGSGALIETVVVENPDSTVKLATDTLKPLGAISGQLDLPESLDASQVRVMVYGLDRVVTPDSAGLFRIAGLAEGKYDLHIGGLGVSLDLRGDRGTSVLSAETTAIPAAVTSLNNTSLVGYWSFDENSGQMAYDASGNGNTGLLGNTAAADFADPVWTAGKIGSCLQFDSVYNTRVIVDAVTSSLDSLTAFTYMAWINPTGYGNYGRILSRELNGDSLDEFEINLTGSDWQNLGAGFTDGSGQYSSSNSDSSTIVLNTWQHIAVTYNDAGNRMLHLFINGTETAYIQAPRTPVGSLPLTSNPLTIGNCPTPNQSFVGRIDEVKVFNRVLSQSEILADVNRQ